MSEIRYPAFISYSHKDSAWGEWLHKRLESYALPKRLRITRPELKKTLYPIFRDREELPGSSDLGENLNDALSQSDSLLVICSPHSAISQWVNEEVLSFQKLSPGQPIIALVIAGQDATPGENGFCLPEELQRLRKNNAGILKYIDARENGRSKTILLQLAAELAGLSLPDLQTEEKKRTRIHYGFVSIVAAALIAIVVGVQDYVQRAEQDRLVAESNQFAAIAEEALARGDQTQAIQAALAALPTNLQQPERPPSYRAAAALGVALNQPVLRLFKAKLTTKPVDMLATLNSQNWLIRDSQNQYHLYDAGRNRIIWSRSYGNVLQNAVNNSGNLVIRTEKGLVNVNPVDGKVRCRLQLSSQLARPQDGSLEWLQKDWTVEWSYRNPKADYKLISHISFVNTQTCKVEETIAYQAISSSVYLVDVLDDGAKITASDVYNSKDEKTYVFFGLWPADKNKPAKLLISVPGRLKSLFAGGLNASGYEGPIVLTDPNENVSYIGFRSTDQKPYELVTYDWQKKKTVRRTTLAGRPLSLWWANRGQKEFLLEISGKNIVSNKTHVITAKTGVFVQKIPSPQGAFYRKSLTKVSPGLSSWAAESDYGVQIASLVAKSTVTFSRSEGELQVVIGTGWIGPSTAIQVLSDGQITILHTAGLEKIKRIVRPGSVFRYWVEPENGRHLMLTWSGKFYWVDQGKTEFVFDYAPVKNKFFYGPFAGRFILTSELVSSGKRLELIDLEVKRVIYSKTLSVPETLLFVDADHLFFRNKTGRAVLVRYVKPDEQIILPDKYLKAVGLSKDRQLIYKVFLKDIFTDKIKLIIKTSTTQNVEKSTSPDLAGPENSLLASYRFFADDSNFFIVQNGVAGDSQKGKISSIDLKTFKQSDIGTFDFAALSGLGTALGLEFDDIVKKNGFLQLSATGLFEARADILIDLKKNSSMPFSTRSGRQLLLADNLLIHGQVLIFQDGLVKLMTLENQTSRELRCDFQPSRLQINLLQYFAKDDIIFIASTKRICAVSRSTGNVVFDTLLPRDFTKPIDWSVPITIFRRSQETGFTLVLGSGLTYDILLNEDWKQLVKKAQDYGLTALRSVNNEVASQ